MSQRPLSFFSLIAAGAILAAQIGTAHAATADEDFQARCSATGVVLCEGFDNAATYKYTSGQTDGVYPPSGSSTLKVFEDTSVKASGAGALRFDIYGKTGADAAGNYSRNFGKEFGQNSTFYVQFRQRFDDNYVNIDWNGLMGTSPKQALIYDKDGLTCANLDITLVDYYATGRPFIYTECGNRSVRTSITDISHFTTDVPYLQQQGSSTTSGYNCQYGKEAKGTGNGQGCFYYPANKWVTFYYKVSIGTYGSANSSIQVWASVDGGPYLEFINVRDFTLKSNSSSSDALGRIMLTPYMTGKNASVDHATAHTWFDELIVSTNPIAVPGGTGTGPVAPNPPSDVRVQ